MVPPPRVSHSPAQVCRLPKTLYGLKQAPRAWFAKFSTVIFDLNSCASDDDSTLFLRSTSSSSIAFLLYVDDMIITGDNITGIELSKNQLQDHFDMKDLG